MLPSLRARKPRFHDEIDRVYVNEKARKELGWTPKFDFVSSIVRLRAGEDFRSELACAIGVKGYHRSQ